MSKLYRVEIEHMTYVLADSYVEAEEIAVLHLADENVLDHCHAEPFAASEVVPSQWQDAIPWGDGDDRTVAQRVTDLSNHRRAAIAAATGGQP